MGRIPHNQFRMGKPRWLAVPGNGSNSSVVMQSSSLVTGFISLAGTFSQNDFSQVKDNSALYIRNPIQSGSDVVPPAAYFLTNGTLRISGDIYMGIFTGLRQFVQYGRDNNIGGIA